MTRTVALLLVAAASASGGCASLTNPVADGIPVRRLPAEVLGRPKSDLRPVPLTLLRQKELDPYRLDRGDVLAVVADGVISDGGPAPIKLPDQSSQSAAVGYPVPVNDDGTISLPRVPPIPVRGKTVTEVEQAIKDGVTGKTPGFPDLVKNPRVTVQLLQRRKYQVLVVREDSQQQVPFQSYNQGGIIGGTRRGAGYTLNLSAGENDVLRALNATGGLPGLDAKNEVVILRGGAGQVGGAADPTRTTRIPLRIYADEPLTLREEDVILKDGDVLSIEARETEVYYTSGLIGAGQFLLPRDYDLDVLQAIAQVRGPLINGSFNQNALVGSAVNSGIGNPNPSLCTVLRKTGDGRQIPIRVDLNRAFIDPRERLLIKAGDIIVMQERPGEAIARYLTNTFRVNSVGNFLTAPNYSITGVGTNP